MFILITFCVINSGLVSLCIFIVFFNKKQSSYCHSIEELYNNFLTHKEKYSYIALSKSFANEKIMLLSTNKTKKIFCEKFLYKKINFLYTVSKFIDYKINSSKLLFRSKNNKILIEQIASVVAWSTITSNSCNLFKTYKKLCQQYNIKSKENKVFKLLLGQQLIYLLFEIECETNEISKIIFKSKSIKKIKKFHKKIFFLAELYGVKKFNKNSTKLLSKYNYNYSKIADTLLFELDDIAKKQKIIITYLIAMFE